MASLLGYGLMGAAAGMGKTLMDEYGRINEEAADIRKEGRDETRDKAKEDRKETRDIAKEKRALTDYQTKAGLDAQIDDAYAQAAEVRREQAQKRRDISLNDLKVQLAKDMIPVEQDAYDKKLEADIADDRQRREEGLDVSRSSSTSDAKVSFTPTETRRVVNNTVAEITGYNSEQEFLEGSGAEDLKLLETGEASIAELISGNDAMSQETSDAIKAALIYKAINHYDGEFIATAKAKEFNTPADIRNRVAEIAANTERLYETMIESADVLHQMPVEVAREKLATRLPDATPAEQYKFLEQQHKKALLAIAEADDKTPQFQSMWKVYRNELKNYWTNGE